MISEIEQFNIRRLAGLWQLDSGKRISIALRKKRIWKEKFYCFNPKLYNNILCNLKENPSVNLSVLKFKHI